MTSSDDGYPSLCVKDCGFYGSADNRNMCSKCYSDFLAQEISKLKITIPVEAQPGPPAPQPDLSCNDTETANAGDAECGGSGREKKRCKKCNKKVGLTGFTCRCEDVFCGSHRYPEEHCCNFDFKMLGRQILAKQNQLCTGNKLHRRA